MWSGGRLNFEALQQRLSAGMIRLAALANEVPANFVGFDVLCVTGHDARDLSPPLSLSPELPPQEVPIPR